MREVVHPAFDPLTGTWFAHGFAQEAPSLRLLAQKIGSRYRIRDFRPMGKISYAEPKVAPPRVKISFADRDDKALNLFAAGMGFTAVGAAIGANRNVVAGIVSRARAEGDARARKRR